MDDFHKHFLSESAEKLRILRRDLHDSTTLTVQEKARAFRVFHTIKGSSQTFGLKSASDLAAKLENLLDAAKTGETGGRSAALLGEGIDLLIRSLEQQEFIIPAEFFEKLPEMTAADYTRGIAGHKFPGIPSRILDQLSPVEKRTLQEELGGGAHIFCIAVSFKLADFAAELRDFRDKLEQHGTIVATFPGEPVGEPGKIDFQILVASSAESAQIAKIARAAKAGVISEWKTHATDLKGIFSDVVSHGEEVAANSGKSVHFEISSDEPELSNQTLALIFEVLLHLVRNAVDHAIAKEGTIRIGLKRTVNGLFLKVSDDGGGIDLKAIRAAAVERQLIPETAGLNDQEMLELIFMSEFSTAAKLTEISGRGVGLNAVKDSLDKAGGTIAVKTKIGRGTDFEIFLPSYD